MSLDYVQKKEKKEKSFLSRKKMDDITLLPDVVLSVLHEVLQCYQGIFNNGHHIFSGPCLHGDQHDPGVELFLKDLRTAHCSMK